jgi:phage repressor protein C with HTH and peptisase S24 domain
MNFNSKNDFDLFRERLRAIVDKFYRGRVADFAKETQIAHSVVSRWLDGYNKPTRKNIILVRNAGFNEEWLLTGEGDMVIDEEKLSLAAKQTTNYKINEPPSDYAPNAHKTKLPEDIYIRLVSVPANAGKSYGFDDIPETMIPVSKRYNNQKNIAFRISGNSMAPLIANNYIVIVDSKRQPVNGDVVVCQFNNELLCKRLKITSEGKNILQSENSEYPEIEINGLNDCKVIGVVVHAEFNFY